MSADGRGAEPNVTGLRKVTISNPPNSSPTASAISSLAPPGSHDRTAVCREGRGAPSAPGLVRGSGFRSPNRPGRGRNPTYRAGLRPEMWCERPSCNHRRQLAGGIRGIPANTIFYRGDIIDTQSAGSVVAFWGPQEIERVSMRDSRTGVHVTDSPFLFSRWRWYRPSLSVARSCTRKIKSEAIRSPSCGRSARCEAI